MTQDSPAPPGPQDRPYAGPTTSPYAPPPPEYATAPNQRYAHAPAPGYRPPAYSAYATECYAPWASRVGAYLLDEVLILPGWLLAVIGIIVASASSGPHGRGGAAGVSVGIVLVVLGYGLMIGLTIWNRWIRAGRTGQSWGKKVLGIRLVRESDGQAIGVAMAFLRDLAHIVDGFFYLGYLWPLWAAKRQTFADKICSTVVWAARPTR